MKTTLISFALATLLASGGCAPMGGGDDETAQKVAALEKSVSELQRSNADLRMKSQTTSALLFRSPLEDFFASPEFWERTYDSGQADCSRRCIAQIQQQRAACAKLAQPQQAACYADAAQRGANCQKQCSTL